MKEQPIITIADSKAWMELQFTMAHRMCAILDGRRYATFQKFQEDVLSNKKAIALIDGFVRNQITGATKRLHSDRVDMYQSIIVSLFKLHHWAAFGFNTFVSTDGRRRWL